MKSFASAAAVALIGLFTSSSFAQDANASNGYLGAEFGSVKFKDQTSLATILVNSVGGTATSTQDTGVSVGRFFGGYAFTENIGAELGYISTSSANATFSGVSRTSVSYSGTASMKTTGLDYSALLRPSKSTGMNGLFVRIGGHSLSTESSVAVVTGTSSGAASSTTTGTGTLIGIGYDGKINDKMDFRVAYTNYNSISGVSGSDLSLWSLGLVFKF